MGAFMKQTSTKAQAAVDKRMARLRQHSPHGGDGLDSPFRLYDAHDSIQGAAADRASAEPLAELASVAASEQGEPAGEPVKASEDDGALGGSSPLVAQASAGSDTVTPLATAASGGADVFSPADSARRRSMGRRPSMAEQHVRLSDAGLGAAASGGVAGERQSERKGVFVRLQVPRPPMPHAQTDAARLCVVLELTRV